MTSWNDELLTNPHAVADKRSRVQRMFAAIAPKYDLNNRLHSFWQDQRWRKRAVGLANVRPTDVVVDVACGTGDLTLRFASAKPVAALGVDFTFEMLPLARIKSTNHKRQTTINYINGDAQSLPLPDASADVVSIAFGIRNVQEPAKALSEFYRILRPGGRVVILEFSQPGNRVIRFFNDLYCSKIMPHTATWIARDTSGAYKYLPMSVQTFMNRDAMMRMMREAGFSAVEQFPMTFGVCVCYRGVK